MLLHLVWFALWATIDAGLMPGVPAFDPFPFQLLCMVVSMEGVLLPTVVLIQGARRRPVLPAKGSIRIGSTGGIIPAARCCY